MSSETATKLPARVQAALDFINHTRWVTAQDDPSIPARTLTPLEQSVESAALRTLQSYFLGEMDYGDAPPVTHRKRDEDDGQTNDVREPQTT